VRTDRYGREKSCANISGFLSEKGVNISASTVHRILRKNGFRKTKPTRKPGLTEAMKTARYNWCLERKDWTLEQWKDVIFSDETAVVLGHRRGGYRVWRTSDEQFMKSCIHPRWKGYSEFMFWGCFSYNMKGPSHCWAVESTQERRAADIAIEKLNAEIEPIAREEWELNTPIERLGLRNKRGVKPVWKFNKKHGRLSREGSGGID